MAHFEIIVSISLAVIFIKICRYTLKKNVNKKEEKSG